MSVVSSTGTPRARTSRVTASGIFSSAGEQYTYFGEKGARA